MADSIEHAGVRAGEIIAWRGWVVYPAADAIRSVYMFKIIWPPGEPLRADPGVIYDVSAGRRRGIHAWKRERRLSTIKADMRNRNGPRWMIGGHVALWGDVVETEEGYLAEFARPVSFDLFEGQRDVLKKLRALYQVDGRS